MNETSAGTDPSSPSPPVNRRIDRVCDYFEEAWLAGRRPRLEEYLLASTEADRPALLRELVLVEVAYRRRRGETPQAEEYRRRFPELAGDWLATVFGGPATQLVEAGLAAETPASRGQPAAAGERFRVLRPYAQGGLGEVLVARDTELDRDVALKRIQDRFAGDKNSRSRFLLEAAITGRLEHPGIVPVYGMGQHADGRPFYAMRLIHGDSLQAAIQRFHEADSPGRDPGRRALELRQLLDRFLVVCNTVAYAHSRQVLHRDLKPANIMLGQYGETLVVDWGLAKRLDEVAITLDGQVLGTPAYMSPEQARGDNHMVTARSDVYSLGATLYHLLTGQPPFAGPNRNLLLERVKDGAFTRPRQANAQVPPVLEAVCLKAMAREPDERYPSPRDLADDLERWLADEPVAVYPERWPTRLRRWARRRSTLATAAAATALVALLLGGAGAWWLGLRPGPDAPNALAGQSRPGDELPPLERYQAARAAVLASAARGKDVNHLDDRERARLRQQALDWLRTDLRTWAEFPDRTRAQEALRHWQQDKDLATVRGEELARLPEAERAAWQALWAELETLLVPLAP